MPAFLRDHAESSLLAETPVTCLAARMGGNQEQETGRGMSRGATPSDVNP